MDEVIIDIIGDYRSKRYRFGILKINKKNEIFSMIPIYKSGFERHTSLHEDGEFHWKTNRDLLQELKRQAPIKEFSGHKWIDTVGASITHIISECDEYKNTLKNVPFIIDFNNYKSDDFHIVVVMYDEVGKLILEKSLSHLTNLQSYIITRDTFKIIIYSYEDYIS